MTPSFFKLYKPRKYNYRPIYYDPKKEEREEREKRLNEEKKEGGEFKTSISRGSFRDHREDRGRMYRDNARKSNIRLLVIIGMLFFFMYLLFKWI